MKPAEPSQPSGPLAALLHEYRAELLRNWTRRVLCDSSIPEANRLDEPELHDHIPKIVDELVCTLNAAEESEAAGRDLGTSEAVVAHARDRAEKGYSLTSVLREFSHFRAALLDLCTAHGVRLDGDAAELVHATIDHNLITGAVEIDRTAVEEERQRAMLRERFVGILGHDLRTPLATIALAAGTLLGRDDTPEAHRLILQRIATSAHRMGRMVHDLLDLSRIRMAGSIPLTPKPTELSALCQTVIEEQKIARSPVEIDLDAPAPVEGNWDPDRLAQVIQNLLGNAVDYSAPNTPVRVALREEHGEAMLSVHNDGPAIPGEAMPHLFEPFRQGPQDGRAGRDESLGLGLFIAKHIVEAHEGRLDVTSTEAGGTTFAVHLPREGATKTP